MNDYRVFEVTFDLPHSQGNKKIFLIDLLESRGIGPQEIIESVYKSKFKISCFVSKKRAAEQIKQAYLRKPLRGISVKVRRLDREDWFDKWKEQYHAFKLGKYLKIIPVWEKESSRGTRLIPIYLDPGAAFGSGTHETTRLMIRMMEQRKNRFKTFLDAGTGTGILSIAAEKLGALEIFAFDSDPASVEATRENFQLNDCGAQVKLLSLEKFRTSSRIVIEKSKAAKRSQIVSSRRIRTRNNGRSESWDVVAGNLISQCLVDHQKTLARAVKPGGYLMISGILIRNLTGFLKEFRPVGMKRMRLLRGRYWAGIVYRKQ